MMKRYATPAGGYVPKYMEMMEAPHLLIGGTTGSGKSVMLNGIIWTLLQQRTPDKACFVLIDPKRVDLRKYARVPHALYYADTPATALYALERTSAVMEERYTQMARRGLEDYTGGPDVYVFIDELADLMLSDEARKIKKVLQHLLQLGRAAHIHCVCATQAPSRKVIPAELVLNFTNRIALRCLSPIESKQIINSAGAENLPRYGSCLYLSSEGLDRLQGIPVIPKDEIMARINYWLAA